MFRYSVCAYFVYFCCPALPQGKAGHSSQGRMQYVQPKHIAIMTKPLASQGKGRYAFLLFDATFKVVVCTPENEKLLIEIIELLIPGKHISHIIFINKEQHGLVIEDKNVTFDLLCIDKDTGEEFLVEVQNAEEKSYRDRMLFYSTYPIREQMAVKMKRLREEGEEHIKGGRKAKTIQMRDYSLKPVYVISMLNFAFVHENDHALEEGYISRYEIRNGQNGEILTPSLHFVFLEMDRLKLGPEDKDLCKNLLERFIFSMKYMHMMTERPAGFDDPLLKDLYKATELASMTMTQRQNYDRILLDEFDRMAQLAFAEEKGTIKTAKQLIAEYGLNPEEVARLIGAQTEDLQ